MSRVGKKVYTVNNETNKIDEWECKGTFKGTFQGHEEKLYMLSNGDKQCILPHRAIYTTMFEAMRVIKKYPKI